MGGFKSKKQKPLRQGKTLKYTGNIKFIITLLAITYTVLVSLSMSAFATSGSSASFNLDYGRLTNDSDQKTSNSFELTDSVSDISAEGDSASFQLRNVYGGEAATCGNGIIEAGEQCETVNFNGLSCSSFGFNSGSLQCVSCNIVVSSCFNTGGGSGGGGGGYICGNGIREASEQCDDGNTEAGDGCNAYCRLEQIETVDAPEITPEHETDTEVSTEPDSEEINNDESEDIVDESSTEDNSVGSSDTPNIENEPTETETDEQSTQNNDQQVDGSSTLNNPSTIPTDQSEGSQADFNQFLDELLKGSAGDAERRRFHFENYGPGEIIPVLDERPLIVVEVAPNMEHELIIRDIQGQEITRQGGTSDSEGILLIEVAEYLNTENYIVEVLDENKERAIAYAIEIKNPPYISRDNLFVGEERLIEYIPLGNLDDDKLLQGKSGVNSKYYAYIELIFEDGFVDEASIHYIKTQADEEGLYSINIPDSLPAGSYQLSVVEVFEDGHVAKNKNYLFNVSDGLSGQQAGESKLPIKQIIVTTTLSLLSFAAGYLVRIKKKKLKKKWLSIFVILLMIGNQTAMAVTTTPGVFIYEGKLLDSSGQAVTTAQTFRFSLWSSDDFVATDLTGAGAIEVTAPNYGGWFEEHTLTPNTDGTFFVELGSITPLPNMVIGTHDHLMVEIKNSGALDTAYELMDPTGDNGTDADDRQTLGSVPYTNNADFLDNAEIGTASGNIATLGAGGLWDAALIPGASNADSFVIDNDDTVGAGGQINLTFGATLNQILGFNVDDDWFVFNNDVSFGQNEIKNVAIDNLAVAPVAPVTGQIYHNTTDGNTYIYNGVSFEDITAGAGGADDFEAVYGADADKILAVTDAAGFGINATTAGDITFDLQNTGDFVIQDNGTTYARFDDSGNFAIGDVTPDSVFHVDSNANNDVAIATFENTAGDVQVFRTDAGPEGSVTASIGDLVVDGTNGNAYIKNSGNATNTGWTQFAGIENVQSVLYAEYEDSTIDVDGSDNKGLLSSHFVNGGGTAKYNYYEWNTREASIQDVDVYVTFRLPDDFHSFTATPLSLLYQTSNGATAVNQVDVAMFDTTGTAVALTGGTDLANAAWTTANITFGGGETFVAGQPVTLRLKMQSTSAGFSRIADIVFDYNRS